MSLLGSQVYANPTTPLWASAGSGGGSSVLSQTLLFYTASLTNGGGPASTSNWTDRPLNAGVPALDGSGNSLVISGLSLNLSNSQVTLPAGTFTYNGGASLDMIVGQAQINVISPTASVQPGLISSADARTFVCPYQGTLTGPCVFTIQTQGQVTTSSDRDLGTAGGFGSNVFCSIQLNKIA
jgi:hypothetical protein